MKIKQFFKKEIVQNEIMDWTLFAVTIILYVGFLVPHIKDFLHKEWEVSLFSFFVGMAMMIVSKIIVRTVIRPLMKKRKANVS